MSAPVRPTAWTPARPNQQLVEQWRHAEREQQRQAQRSAQLHDLGTRLQRAWAGLPLPLIAVQTHFSLLEGTASPGAWGEVLAAWHGAALPPSPDRRGGNHPGGASAVAVAEALLANPPAVRATAGPPDVLLSQGVGQGVGPGVGVLAALADRDDLLGLPATLTAWGRQRTAVGATLCCHAQEVVALAPTAAAYAALCTWLSRRHDHEQALPPLRGLRVLVREAALGAWLAAAGAEVFWRAEARPVTDQPPFPVVAVPLLTHIEHDRVAAPVLRAIRERGTISRAPGRSHALAELLAMPAAYRGYEAQLTASAAWREAAWAVPASAPQTLHLPPLPPALAACDADAELRRLAEAGIPQRYGAHPPPAVRVRLEYELAVITGKRFASYIVTVHAIVRGRRTCGRGSAASSLVVYLLGITNVDPLRWNLLFERFLSPERVDPPDIDVDFPWDERDDVLAWIVGTFGSQRVGMVATHQHLSGNGALREAARAHGLPDTAITMVGQQLHDLRRYGMSRSGESSSGESSTGENHDSQPSSLPEPWPAVLAAAAHLRGAPRHVGVHCGGVVITRGPLTELVVVHPAAKTVAADDAPEGRFAMPTIAWEKDGAEELGLVKIDILGNRSLAVIRDCLADLRALGDDVEATWQPLSDSATSALLARGETIGCFYVESPAMRQLQAKVGDGSFERLVVHSSIIRPAGMAFINVYIARHHHLRSGLPPEPDWYPHPALAELVSESYGVLSYQEDVMLVAQRMASFSPGEANRLRKALGRADTAERLAQQVGAFVAGCRAQGIADAVIDLVWRMISSFAGYSFAKAHSASYAMVSMQCAWLKAHHPAVFLARVIANEGGFYRRSAYVEEARRLGLTILPPCVQLGQWATHAEHGAIRLGLHCVSGLSRATALAIRREQGFTGVRDLLQRTPCASDELTALLEAGALERLLAALTPAQRAWTVAIVGGEQVGVRTRRGQQGQLMIALLGAADPLPPDLPAIPASVIAQRRWQRLGALPEAHPLCLRSFRRRPPRRAVDIPQLPSGSYVAFIAQVITRKTVNAVYHEADGLRTADMAFVTLEDETAVVETTWFPETFKRYAALLERGEPLLITGTVERSWGLASIAVRHVATCG
jgi:DNA polymerase-3 subunit alpha/error-prone DNA polymerase